MAYKSADSAVKVGQTILKPAANHALTDANAMAVVFQAHPVATLLLAPDGNVVDANQAAEQLLNRSRAALIGHSLDQLINWPGDPGLTAMLHDPGKSLWAYSVDISHGQPAGLQASLIADITLGPASSNSAWRVLAIHPLPRGGRIPFRRPGSAARSAGAAAAMLAHEIKNPLSGIRGAAQLLGKATSAADPAELSALIVGEVDRIAKLIDGMQDFTRDAALKREPLNIYPAIAQAKAIAAQGFAASTKFIEEFDPSLPTVLGNHDALVQILLNLIKNACEAAQGNADPTVRLITAYRHGLSWDAGDGRGQQSLPVEICVADNGPGVSEGLADSLFDPFVTDKRDGQGLGLALVDKLAREMGGLVQHDRAADWTRFRIHLPLGVPIPIAEKS